MALLHYANLPLSKPENVLRQVYHGLKDVSDYLNRAIAYIEETVLRAAWRPIGPDDVDPPSGEDRTAGVWIELDDAADARRDDDGRSLRAFFADGVECIYERVDRPSPDGRKARLDLSRERRIEVRDRNPDRQRLCLARLPESAEILLKPETYTLRKQRDAVRDLQNAPHPGHQPLISLFQGHRWANWKDVIPEIIAEDKWLLLKSKSNEGLRPGTDEQRKFVQIALGTPDFAILEGPPGSGKTTSICELILQALRRDQRVLLCASTHVAVDNVIERLMAEDQPFRDEVIPVRIGDRKKIKATVKQWQFETLQKTERERLRKWLRNQKPRSEAQTTLLNAIERAEDDVVSRIILDSANVVCGTTIGILQHPDIRRGTASDRDGRVPMFDMLIVDEASKTTFQEFLVPALLAKKWILVGDARQLSPYVEEDHVAVNVDAAVPNESVRLAALDAFDVAQFTRNPLDFRSRDLGAVVVAIDSQTTRDAYQIEAARRNVPVVDLDANPNADSWVLAQAGMILGTEARILRHASTLPLDIAAVRGGGAQFDRLERRVRARKDSDEQRTWGSEVAWRLSRSYEKRLLRSRDGARDSDYHLKEAQDLLPDEKSLALTPIRTKQDQTAREAAWEIIDRVRRIALPSILESLQTGFERRAGQREGTALSDGLPEHAFDSRHVLLTYQHRMHPEISQFSRDNVYDTQALLDPRDMAGLRDWPDALWATRMVWLDVHSRADGMRNEREGQAIVRELQRFLRWSRTHRHPQGRPWEIAVLTFYRAQEKLLRRMLRKELGQPHGFERFVVHRGKQVDATIDLCTVDRFQGHEADLVLLSFGRTHGVGFLDSPNRLNVALTRARYQVLLVGRRQNFATQKGSELLRRLAELPAAHDL